jgi:hypothetical protein
MLKTSLSPIPFSRYYPLLLRCLPSKNDGLGGMACDWLVALSFVWEHQDYLFRKAFDP